MESSSNSGLVGHGAKVQQTALHLTQKGLFPGWGNKVQRTARSKHLREVPHFEHLIFERLTRNIFSSFVSLTEVSFTYSKIHPLCIVLQVALVVKNPPAMQETQVQTLGQEDPLGEGMATHSSIMTQKIP